MRYDLGDALLLLGRTPTVLTTLLGGLPDSWVYAEEGKGTWSPISVLAHLIHGERTDWIPRARSILAQGESTVFEPFDRFAHLDAARTRPLEELLAEFRALRAESLTALQQWKLSDADLDRRGIHPDFGPVTLRQLLATWVAHDLGHIGQIVRVMAKQYRDEVGPWGAYLPILVR